MTTTDALAKLGLAHAAFLSAVAEVRVATITAAGGSTGVPGAVRTVNLIVATHYGLALEQMVSDLRGSQRISTARLVAVALCLENTGYLASDVAAVFNRTHNMAGYARRKVADWCATDAKFATEYTMLNHKVVVALQENHPDV